MSNTTLANKAYSQVRARIASGELGEGTRITEASISSLLGVGRGPARETLLRLEADGLIHRPGPRCARYIKSVEEQSLTDVQHQYELREVIDGLAARRAALAMNGEQILALRALIEQLAHCLQTGDRKQRLSVIHSFYTALRQQSGNPLLALALNRCGVNTPFFLNDAPDVRAMQLLAERHPMVQSLTGVIDAIDAHDPERAETAMRAWTRGSWEAVRDALQSEAIPN